MLGHHNLQSSYYSILKFKEHFFHTEDHVVCILIHYHFSKQEVSNQARVLQNRQTEKKQNKTKPRTWCCFMRRIMTGERKYILAMRSVTGLKRQTNDVKREQSLEMILLPNNRGTWMNHWFLLSSFVTWGPHQSQARSLEALPCNESRNRDLSDTARVSWVYNT